jgi:hypothetical protein
MLECRTVRHQVNPIPELTEMLMPEPARYLNKGIQSSTGMLRYRTEIQDAGIPMSAASTSMPMPSYDNSYSDMSQAPFLSCSYSRIKLFFLFSLYEICRRPHPMGLPFLRIVRLPISVQPRIRNYVVLITSKALYQRAS